MSFASAIFDAVISQMVEQGRILRAAKRGVSFLRRTEVGFDSEVNLHISTDKPAAAPLGEFGGLGDFLHAEQIEEEAPCLGFASGRHSQLYVIDGDQWTG